ncbi:tRNA pseudouridine(38-40) synthase TruA [Rhabdochlamydiaceae symbiont of Dictyostelium giganteum]|uniref:tRNA pseudouridine(38-40) synthase TruA n=1 Tax=Rhabdochlamydiaceae symbiont of Dictyostelium giganteum TaxID=3342349 RepID=UPI00384A5046
MNKYKITLAYDGTSFSGWQTQQNGIAIQMVIEDKLSILLRHPVSLTGAGRTDAGVHAQGQVAHFETALSLNLFSFFNSLNALLPLTIRVLTLEPISPSFHARYSAISKEYHYLVDQGRVCSPFQRLYSLHHPLPLDLKALEKGCSYFKGTHDFTSFANKSSEGAAGKNAVRTLFRLDIKETPCGFRLEFEGNGFLYKMVRNITGVLLDIGKKKLAPEAVLQLMEAKDRSQSSMVAPAKGLSLIHVIYPDFSFL